MTPLGATDPRRAMAGVRGQMAGGVTVVIACADGEPYAATATAVTVASLDPPLVATFFGVDGQIHDAIARGRRFTVSLLPEESGRLAKRLGRPGRTSGWAGLTGVELVRRGSGPPVLAEAIAWVDCELVKQVSVGDHSCFIGHVLELDRRPEREPLVYYRGRFHRLGTATTPTHPMVADPHDGVAVW